MPVEAIEIISLSVAFIKRESTQFISRNPHSFAIEGLPVSVVVIDVLHVKIISLLYENESHNQDYFRIVFIQFSTKFL